MATSVRLPRNLKESLEGGQLFWTCTEHGTRVGADFLYISRGQDSLADIWFTRIWLEHGWVSPGPNYNHIASASHKLLREKVTEALIQGQWHVYFSFRKKVLEKIKWVNLLIQPMCKTWEESLQCLLPAGTWQLPKDLERGGLEGWLETISTHNWAGMPGRRRVGFHNGKTLFLMK